MVSLEISHAHTSVMSDASQLCILQKSDSTCSGNEHYFEVRYKKDSRA